MSKQISFTLDELEQYQDEEEKYIREFKNEKKEWYKENKYVIPLMDKKEYKIIYEIMFDRLALEARK